MDMRWIVHIFVWTHVILFLLAGCFYDGSQVWLGRFMGGSMLWWILASALYYLFWKPGRYHGTGEKKP